MTSADVPPTSRRALRTQAAPEQTEPPSLSGRIALAWVDVDALEPSRPPRDLTAAASPYVPVLPDLVRRRRVSAAPLVAVTVVLALLGGYTAATQLWSAEGLVPTVEPAAAQTVTAPPSALTWPDEGVAAAGIGGMDAVASSSKDAVPMASITKLIPVLMVLEREPLSVGDPGPSRQISYSDRVDYWNYLGRGESALNVPVGGSLTRYEQLQGVLLASAGNYVDLLTRDFWPTDAAFAAAARAWLDRHDLRGIEVVEPTGIDRSDTADAASLIRLGELALANPVVAEIVAQRTAEITGVGEIENTNPLVGDDGVVGIKTGGLTGFYNLLAAADVESDTTPLRVYAVVLGQPTEELRGTEVSALLEQIAAEAAVPQALTAGTAVATVTTDWGTRADVVTTSEAPVTLWNGASATSQQTIELAQARESGQTVGSLTLTGPVDSATVELTLEGDLGEPDPWWRFTHPVELFGLTDR